MVFALGFGFGVGIALVFDVRSDAFNSGFCLCGGVDVVLTGVLWCVLVAVL